MDTANTYSASKLTLYGNYYKLKQYRIPYKCGKLDYEIKKRNKEDIKDFEKREDNLYRSRKKVRDIISCNVTEHSKFLTLTTKDIVLDEKVFRRRLTSFFQAMKRNGYELRYLYVLERQKERGAKEGNIGSFHAHIIIFNDEFIPFEIINKYWYGITDIHMLNGLKYKNNVPTDEVIESVAWYVCKYITKDNLNDFNKHCYFTSKGLHRPMEFSLPVYKIDDTYVYDFDDEEHEIFKSIQAQFKVVENSTFYSPLFFDNNKIQKTHIKKGVKYG